MLHTKYQGSMPCSFRQEDFYMFILRVNISLFKTYDPWGGAIFSPMESIWTNLTEVH